MQPVSQKMFSWRALISEEFLSHRYVFKGDDQREIQMNGFDSRLQLELNFGNVTHYKYKNIIHKETQLHRRQCTQNSTSQLQFELMYAKFK